MRLYSRQIVAALLVGVLAMTGSASASAFGVERSTVFGPDAAPYDRTLTQWTVAWWQWTMGTAYEQNPNLDPTGANCGMNQTDPKVWYFATTFNSADAQRTCVVQGRRALLINLSGTLNDYPCPFPFEPAPGQSLEDFLAEGAKQGADGITAVTLTVDGKPIPNLFDYRTATRLFTFTGDISMKRLDPCVTGTPQVAVADGYIVMVKPLPPGTHQVDVTGRFVSGNVLTVRTSVIVTG